MNFPIPRSDIILSMQWLSERIPYPDPQIKGDTFPMTWADDDEIYTSAGDPLWGESTSGLDIEKISGPAENYKIHKVNQMNDYLGWGGNGLKPSGMICVENILYLAFQNLLLSKKPAYGLISQHGSDAQIVYSSVKGLFFTPALNTIKSPMFPGNHFGGPAFINFGKNNENAFDDFIYAVSSDQWDNGSNLRLGRVPKERIAEPTAWQWVCSFDLDGHPVWGYCLEDSIPILSLYRWISLPEMVYLAEINRYLLLTWHLHEDFSPDSGTDLLVLESPSPWGPFSFVHYEEFWEGKLFNPYCPRLPLKWLEGDGVTGWPQFSGSWGPYGQAEGYYRSNVQKFRLKLK
jgi:hypothetical protein